MIRSGPTFEVLAKNTLDDGFDASPALVDNEILPARVQAPVQHRGAVNAQLGRQGPPGV